MPRTVTNPNVPVDPELALEICVITEEIILNSSKHSKWSPKSHSVEVLWQQGQLMVEIHEVCDATKPHNGYAAGASEWTRYWDILEGTDRDKRSKGWHLIWKAIDRGFVDIDICQSKNGAVYRIRTIKRERHT
jgi:two-component sensor histidine kinase